MISIYLFKLLNESICKPLNITFEPCLTQDMSPSEWKKSKEVLINKKNDKQCVKKYRPVSLLAIYSFTAIFYKTTSYQKVSLVLTLVTSVSTNL